MFDEVLCDAVGNATYLRTTGPTQLAYGNREIFGHGVDYHGQGFGSPIGYLKDFSRCLSEYTIDELKARAVNENFAGSCPACGMFHLTRADIDKIVSEKISETEHYAQMKREAEQA